MAKITFTHIELFNILISNELLPEKILRPKVEGQEIHFTVETNLPLLQYVPASLKFLSGKVLPGVEVLRDKRPS